MLKNTLRSLATVLVMSGLAAFGPVKAKGSEPVVTQPAQDGAVKEVQDTFDRYIDAWKRGDMKAWSSVYVNDDTLTAYWPDPTRTYPIKGWQNVSKGLAEVADAIGGMNLTYTDRDVQVIGDMAVLTAKWTWNDITTLKTPISPKAQDALLSGQGTFIFVRRGSQWLVVHEHSSVPWWKTGKKTAAK